MAKILTASELERGKKYEIIDQPHCYIICHLKELYFTFFSYEGKKGIVIPNFKLNFDQITKPIFVEVK